MALYELKAGTRRQLIDQDGAPIAEGTTSVVIEDTGVVALTASDGFLLLRGLAVGASDVTITRNGSAQTHEVTVVDPFDWSLGELA